VTEIEIEEIPIKHKKKTFLLEERKSGVGADSGTGHPESLWSLHPWKYSKPERTWL